MRKILPIKDLEDNQLAIIHTHPYDVYIGYVIIRYGNVFHILNEPGGCWEIEDLYHEGFTVRTPVTKKEIVVQLLTNIL